MKMYLILQEPRHNKPIFGVSDQQNVQPQKMDRGLKFQIQEVEGLYMY